MDRGRDRRGRPVLGRTATGSWNAAWARSRADQGGRGPRPVGNTSAQARSRVPARETVAEQQFVALTTRLATAEPAGSQAQRRRDELGREVELPCVRSPRGGARSVEVPAEARQAARTAGDRGCAVGRSSRPVKEDQIVEPRRAGPAGDGAGERLAALTDALKGFGPHEAGAFEIDAAVERARQNVDFRLVEEED